MRKVCCNDATVTIASKHMTDKCELKVRFALHTLELTSYGKDLSKCLQKILAKNYYPSWYKMGGKKLPASEIAYLIIAEFEKFFKELETD